MEAADVAESAMEDGAISESTLVAVSVNNAIPMDAAHVPETAARE